jgi:penicillin amidase
MPLPPQQILQRLGCGASIAEVCAAAGTTRAAFDVWWRAATRSRVPPSDGTRSAPVQSRVRIERDQLGIPHIFADNDADLFFGFGCAMAQDRLFQLDYLRRRGAGRLAEILGPTQIELDRVARTIDLPGIAEREWADLPDATRMLVAAFAGGINLALDAARGSWPVEFEMLDYEPESWRPQDCLVIAGEFRWYLTGRFPVICIPELAKRALGGDGPLYRAFLQAEADAECILPPGSYTPLSAGSQRGSPTGGDPDGPRGSNNWVLSGSRSASGMPLVASDPHIAFAAVSCWYEVRLTGGSFDVCGMAYTGIPAVMFGRNRRIAWGITNNICSLRDLYLEREDPAHPGCFLYDSRWEPAQHREETILVKGASPVRYTIRSSRHGPIVDEILPPAARNTGPVSLRWQGAEPCRWLTSLLTLDRAASVAEAHEALRGWLVPTFCLVFADVDGRIGYRAAGEIPIRRERERGYRQGWNPAHEWDGRIPFHDMPHVTDPAQGYVATANNRVAADDYPQPLSGTWASGHRAQRLREMITSRDRHAVQDCMQMQQDVVSLRARNCLPYLLRELASDPFARVQAARSVLSAWDCRMELDRVGATLFNVFFARWCRAVVDERLPVDAAELAAPAVSGLAATLLAGDDIGWFHSRPRCDVLRAAFRQALEELTQRFGPDMATWQWGRLHRIVQRHFLSGVGDLGQLLDRGDRPVTGDGYTVCNTGFDPDGLATVGAGYRMVADLADPEATLYAVDAGAESGHPGSPHYDDQLTTWLDGSYHVLKLADTAGSAGRTCYLLQPESCAHEQAGPAR